MSRGKAETRHAILQAALQLLEEHGADVTMQDIATQASVSRQALYLHFDNRTDLLTQLVLWMDTERFDLASRFAPVEAIADPVERLSAFVDAALRYQPLVAPVARALMDAAHHGDSAAGAALENRMDARRRACRDLVRRLDGDGRLHPALSAATATDLLWALIGFPLWFDLTETRGWSHSRARRELARLAQRALANPASPNAG